MAAVFFSALICTHTVAEQFIPTVNSICPKLLTVLENKTPDPTDMFYKMFS